jgi:hypothetical protein
MTFECKQEAKSLQRISYCDFIVPTSCTLLQMRTAIAEELGAPVANIRITSESKTSIFESSEDQRLRNLTPNGSYILVASVLKTPASDTRSNREFIY